MHVGVKIQEFQRRVLTYVGNVDDNINVQNVANLQSDDFYSPLDCLIFASS